MSRSLLGGGEDPGGLDHVVCSRGSPGDALNGVVVVYQVTIVAMDMGC